MIIARTRGRRGMSRLPIGGWPVPGGIEVREAEVLAFEATERLGGFYRERRRVDVRARGLGHALELVAWLGHPSVRVVASPAGRDQELPVARPRQPQPG